MITRLLAALGLLVLALTAHAETDLCGDKGAATTFGERVRWLVGGSASADACLESAAFYERLRGVLDEAWRLNGQVINDTSLSEVAVNVRAIAHPPRVAVDLSEMDLERLKQTDNWKQGAGSAHEQVLMAFPRECFSAIEGAQTSCDREFERLTDGLALMHFMQRVSTDANRDEIERQLRRSAFRVAKWDAYLSSQQFQYPWELGLNFCAQQPWEDYSAGWQRAGCFVPVASSAIGMRVRDHVGPVGWEEVPEWRFIFLHPEAAVSYSSEPSGGDQVNAALVFEWIGAYWWNWNDEGWQKPGDPVYDCVLNLCPLGVSFAAAYVDLPDNDELGHGVSLHVRNFAFTATKHDGENGEDDAWVYSVSLNLSKLFEAANNDVGRAMRNLFVK